MLPRARLLAVALADGTVKLWDANVHRERLLWPPTLRGVHAGAGAAAGDAAAASAGVESDDAAWSPAPRECIALTRLPLRNLYAFSGTLDAARGELVTDTLSPSARGGAAVSTTLSIGLAALDSLRSRRPPARIVAPHAVLSAAAAFFDAFASAGGVGAPSPLTAREGGMGVGQKSPAIDSPNSAGLATTRRGGSPVSDIMIDPARVAQCGYVYLLDDATVLLIDSPADSVFDARFIELSDDAFFCAFASRSLPIASFDVLKRVLGARARVLRVIFFAFRGGPVNIVRSALSAITQVSTQGTLARAGLANISVASLPVAAAPLSVLTAAAAGALDAATAGLGGAAVQGLEDAIALAIAITTPARGAPLPSIECTPMPPFLVIPFYVPGDGPAAVASLAPTGEDVAPAAPPPGANPARAAVALCDAAYAASGTVVTVSATSVRVALDHEDRAVNVPLSAVVLLVAGGTGMPFNGAPSASPDARAVGGARGRVRGLLPGDSVRVPVRPVAVDVALGLAAPPRPGSVHDTDGAGAAAADAAAAGFDAVNDAAGDVEVLAILIDELGSTGLLGSVMAGARVRRKVSLWVLGRARDSVPVLSLTDRDTFSDSSSPSAASSAQSHASWRAALPAALVRSAASWAAAGVLAHARSGARSAGDHAAAMSLFEAVSATAPGAGSGAAAGSLQRTLTAITAAESDAPLDSLFNAIGLVWGLAQRVAAAAAASGEVWEWDNGAPGRTPLDSSPMFGVGSAANESIISVAAAEEGTPEDVEAGEGGGGGGGWRWKVAPRRRP